MDTEEAVLYPESVSFSKQKEKKKTKSQNLVSHDIQRHNPS